MRTWNETTALGIALIVMALFIVGYTLFVVMEPSNVQTCMTLGEDMGDYRMNVWWENGVQTCSVEPLDINRAR